SSRSVIPNAKLQPPSARAELWSCWFENGSTTSPPSAPTRIRSFRSDTVRSTGVRFASRCATRAAVSVPLKEAKGTSRAGSCLESESSVAGMGVRCNGRESAEQSYPTQWYCDGDILLRQPPSLKCQWLKNRISKGRVMKRDGPQTTAWRRSTKTFPETQFSPAG